MKLKTDNPSLHSWAPMLKKNIDWIDTDNRLTAKNIDKIDGRHKKKILIRWINKIGQKSNFFHR
jgi:hypothetical protein